MRRTLVVLVLGSSLSSCSGTPPSASMHVPPRAPAQADARQTHHSAAPLLEERLAEPKRPSAASAASHLGFTSLPVVAQPSHAARLKLHFLDVGQGDSTLIECPGGGDILVDGGSGIGAAAAPERAREALLSALAGRALASVLITHPDRDHYNALPYLLEGASFGGLIVGGADADYSGSEFRRWLGAVPRQQRRDVERERHDPADKPAAELDCGAASVFVLSAGVRGENARWAKNTSSLVLLVSYGDFDAILSADATTETESAMLASYPEWWLTSELLKLGHHGAETSSGEAWLSAVRPHVATVSAADTRHGHPRKRVVERVARHTRVAAAHRFRWYDRDSKRYEELAAYREAIYSTATSGHVRIESDGSRYWIARER